jgi:ABC-2 type transport system ATP-binding protein
VVAGASAELLQRLAEQGCTLRERGDVFSVEVEGQEPLNDVLRKVLEGGAQVVEVTARRETLEDLFLRRAL